MRDPAAHRWVDSGHDLRQVVEALNGCGAFGLDSESNSGFAYRERLCLLQLSDGDRIWLLDLLALGDAHLEPLRGILESARHRVWVHGGEFDVGCLKRDYQLQLRGLWDTQQAASFLGWPRTGYGAVVQRICGVKLAKDHTRFDWRRRPLPPEALAYAANDVLYLPRVGAHLERAVREADLEEEVDTACRAVEAATWNGGFDPSAVWSIKGARGLPDPAKPLLVALHQWRERVARQLDRPPGRTLHNQVLLALSRSAPTEMAALKDLGVPARIRSRWGHELLAVIAAAGSDPPALPPVPPRRPPDRRARERGAALKAWRRREAERRGVPLQVVLPLAALKHLQEHGAGELSVVPQLGDKRIRLYGETLRELVGLEGR